VRPIQYRVNSIQSIALKFVRWTSRCRGGRLPARLSRPPFIPRKWNPFSFPGGQPAAPTILLILFCVSPSVWAYPAKVLLSTTTLLPGDTLRVEVDGLSPEAKLRAYFGGKIYPFYAVGPNAQRALIGVKLDEESGRQRLQVRLFSPTRLTWKALESQELEISSRPAQVENVSFSAAKLALMKAEHQESLQIHRANRLLSRDQQWEGVFMYPVDGPVIGEFGVRRIRNGKIQAGFHKGVDLKANKGTPVLSANSGTVVLAARYRAHGRTVLVNHGQGVMTIYLHMQSIAVKLHQKVKKGQPIGTVGSTGLSTAPHVHFQVYVHGVPVDPKPWTESEF
jgi:hypothetical protein